MIELILLLQAELDIQALFSRCEEYQAGRGEIFMRQVDAAFTLLREHPEIAPVYAGQYRRMLLRNFPFGIFYQAQPRRIIVAAILDLRQDPKSIQRRLGQK
jgi:plasmid stabilization system protein ParE